MKPYKGSVISLTILIMLLLVLLVSGCGGQALNSAEDSSIKADEEKDLPLNDETDKVVVYFELREGKALVPVTIDVSPTQEAPKRAVQMLLEGPSSKLLTNTIPAGTELRDIYFKKNDRTVYLLLSNEIRKVFSKERAQKAIDAIVLTITEFEAIDCVQILIDGQEPQVIEHMDLDRAFERPDIVNPLEDKIENPVRVYFSDSQARYLVPVTVNSPADALKIRVETALKTLLKGPSNNRYGLISTVWEGTRLNYFQLSESDGSVVVDLSQEAVAYGGGHTAEAMFIRSLVYTLTEIEGINKVRLLLDGETRDYLPEGTPIGGLLGREDI